MKPMLIVVSAPSGAGKSTLCDRLLQDYPETVYSVSCTTRLPRGEEEDGIDYHFLNDEAFDQLVRAHAFLEYACVHNHRYGTLEAPVREAFDEGLSVLMDIDVNGAEQIRNKVCSLPENDPLHEDFVDIFVMPPSLEVLRERLLARGEDTPGAIELRLKNAVGELECADDFQYRVVNNDLDIAYRDLCAILECVGGVNGPAVGRAASENEERVSI